MRNLSAWALLLYSQNQRNKGEAATMLDLEICTMRQQPYTHLCRADAEHDLYACSLSLDDRMPRCA